MNRLAIGLLVMLIWGGVAHAGPITFGFTGTVSQDPLLDPDDPFGGTIAAGTTFSGTYTFESTTPDGDASASGGSYTSSPGSLSVTIGGNPFVAADLLNIGVLNDAAGSDFYTVFAQNTSGADPFDVSLTLQDTDGTALGGTALLTNAPAFAAFELATLFFNGQVSGNQVQIDGVLTSLTCLTGCVPGGGTGVRVPEPTTLALLGAGLGAVALGRRRGSRRVAAPQHAGVEATIRTRIGVVLGLLVLGMLLTAAPAARQRGRVLTAR